MSECGEFGECSVMPALVAGIHVLNAAPDQDVDGRNKSGHDELLA